MFYFLYFLTSASERKVRVTLLVSCWCCKLITILMPAHLDTWENTNTFLFSLGLESIQWVLTRAVTFDSSSTCFFCTNTLFRYFQTLDGGTWVGLVWRALMNLRMQTLKNFFLSFKDTHITVNFFVSCILWCLYSIFVLVNLWSLLMKVCMQLRSAHYNALTRPDGPNPVRILERLPKSKPQLEWQPGNREVKFQI